MKRNIYGGPIEPMTPEERATFRAGFRFLASLFRGEDRGKRERVRLATRRRRAKASELR